ncbi:serine/threonine-protein phosphatase 7 long form homolog [Rutidosis leptorrhynchoides]|uniref:serine/threonine-protein phosphatase 7 long form homolog n=1 Tax=Rutidosis leptorrhynchoides TaxID=125765 RepID=UPI003A99F5DA
MSSNNFCEESEDLIVVITPTSSKDRNGRFLGPILKREASRPNRPSRPVSTAVTRFSFLEDLKFIGWLPPQNKWREWVNAMKPINAATWMTAGINDAIMNSVLNMHQNNSVIFWFAEKWSPKTNTFILPWGEITVTLEDVTVLGNFSVLGEPATCQVESLDEHAALNELYKAYRELVRSPSKKAVLSGWMKMFMGTHKVYEHEAFLTFWLSKYLFPSVKDTIVPETFHLAVLLARGRRIALAPAVLATLYRDLHLIQNAILDLQERETKPDLHEVFAPMYYLQVWIWKRFPLVGPSETNNGDGTRLARWAGLDSRERKYGTLDSVTGKEHFVWRPYVEDANHLFADTIYNENESYRRIDNEALDSFARCLRISKLVGLDIIQQYFPQRVCKQFGYDQDIPPYYVHLVDDEDAWADYTTSLSDKTLYLPSRRFEGRVTARYEFWWGSGPVDPTGSRVPLPTKRQRRKRITAN